MKLFRLKLHLAFILLIPVLMFALWAGLTWYSNAHPDFGEHVAHVDWLPDEASDVSFFISYSYTAYEFKISEAVFVEEVCGKWTFNEITGPENISRYNFKLEYAGDALNAHGVAMVTNGVSARCIQPDGGGYHAVYDRDTGTGYVQTNPR